MAIYFSGTKEECEAVQTATNRAFGYPKKDGVHVGGGVHVEIPEVHYPGAPGWTEKQHEIVKGKSGDFAVCVEPIPFDEGKLDAKELADFSAVKTKLEAATDLPVDWFVEAKVKVLEEPKEPKEHK